MGKNTVDGLRGEIQRRIKLIRSYVKNAGVDSETTLNEIIVFQSYLESVKDNYSSKPKIIVLVAEILKELDVLVASLSEKSEIEKKIALTQNIINNGKTNGRSSVNKGVQENRNKNAVRRNLYRALATAELEEPENKRK